jgi:hypothetical protein
MLRWTGIAIAIVFGVVLAVFLLSLSPLLAEAAPRPLEAWRFVEEKGVRMADHSEAFEELNITSYEGSKTCIRCHGDEVEEVTQSIHYRMAATVTDVAGMEAVLVGSRIIYNDYCGSIFWQGTRSINFIGKAVLRIAPPGKEELVGRLLATGCSMCHGVSLGRIPSLQPSEEDFDNVDCLVCHHVEYKGGFKGVKEGWRTVVKVNGKWRYLVAPNVSATELARKIAAKPPKEACLWCHGFSGGGPGFKRPNLSPDLMGNVSESFDVHMARGMQCVDCHRFDDHQIDTSGALDTWSHTGKGDTKACSDCHPQGERHRAPLVGYLIEVFHHRVACQTCHIPFIAHGKYPTDVYRDWSHVEFNEKLGRWEPRIELKGNITPVYAWWNGRERLAYIYPEPVEPVNDTIVLVAPVGEPNDPGSKIYPFKLHVAVVPFDEKRKIPIPIKVGIVFATGRLEKAISAGAELAGLEFTGKFVKLVRYMSVNHGVVPRTDALRCIDCHSPWGRMPWAQLGYGLLPMAIYVVVPVGFIVGVAMIVLSYVLERRARATE